MLDITDQEAAQLALLVMYAWDMCDADSRPDSTAVDPRIQADGYDVIGFITGADDIITSGPQGIRQNRVAAGDPNDRRRYGYVARRRGTSEYVAAIRGTDGAEEWFDNFVFVSAPHAPFAGKVEKGFADIYASMQFYTLADPADRVSLCTGLAGLLLADGQGDASLTIFGHSLGSVLATYASYDLTANFVPPQRVETLLFASPKPGDHDFINGFVAAAGNYLVINYEHDLVPKVPPFDLLHFDIFRALPDVKLITDETAQARLRNDVACFHHLIDYIAMLSPPTYQAAIASPWFTADDRHCAACVV